jgi:hypothetical protein
MVAQRQVCDIVDRHEIRHEVVAALANDFVDEPPHDRLIRRGHPVLRSPDATALWRLAAGGVLDSNTHPTMS